MVKFRVKTSKGRSYAVICRDSFSFITSSLNKAFESMGIESEKEPFPHDDFRYVQSCANIFIHYNV